MGMGMFQKNPIGNMADKRKNLDFVEEFWPVPVVVQVKLIEEKGEIG